MASSTASRQGPSCAAYCASSTAVAAEAVVAAVWKDPLYRSVTLAIWHPAMVLTAAWAIRDMTSSKESAA